MISAEQFLVLSLGIGSKRMEPTMMKEQPLDELVIAFLMDLAHTHNTQQIRRA
jgi:hypothetical protein